MATKRRPIHSSSAGSTNMNFRGPGDNRTDAKGTRPTATPTSVREVLMTIILYLCKKAIFFDINLKVALYLGSLFLVSLIGDFIPYPKTYFARSDNLFNLYFVKLGWAWTLMLSTPFIFMTSYTICCGDVRRLMRNHAPRIMIATSFWFIWTKLFNVVETAYGRCSVKNFDTKSSCLKAGYLWHGFDISGHAFILIYSSLVLIEEARPILGWEGIKEHLRNEEHSRVTADSSYNRNPLKNLKDDEMSRLNYLYNRFTPPIRLLFIGITVLQLLWDIMLVGTMLYYHKMIEKVVSGIIAILTWYFTYRTWYPSTILPDSPGKGLFMYHKEKIVDPLPLRRRASLLTNQTSKSSIPKFMGMPLNMGVRPDKAPPTTFSTNANSFANPEPGPSRF